jgi:Ca-activated chloride channel family protein
LPGAEVLVAFNVRRVTAYRLIGYEGRRERESDAVGDTLNPGQVVTALYEIVPVRNMDEGEWFTVKMRYQGTNDRLSRSLMGQAATLAEASADFRFAAAAAEFGLLLRESEYRGNATYAAVRSAARNSKGTDADGRRAEFLAMVDAAEQLHLARQPVGRDAKAS